MSADKEQEYFSDGISEELLNRLAKVPGLRVISRTSAFSYKGKDVRLGQIATEVDVVHILEGSIRKAGNQIRITAQLIDARSDSHLWSETYDHPLDIAYVFAYRGEADRAYEWLDRAVDSGDGGLSEILAEPFFAKLHDDPRWLPFLESIGKSPAQLKTIEFAANLPD